MAAVTLPLSNRKLPFDLMEIGPIRLCRDQRIELRYGDLHAGFAIGGDSPGVVRSQGLNCLEGSD